MTIVPVRLSENSYRIAISASLIRLGSGFKEQVSFPHFSPKKALVISHPFLQNKYGRKIQTSLESAGIETEFALIPEGEKNKNLKVVEGLYHSCVKNKLDRSSCIIGLGGGVVGDIAGFVAATYLRGIPLVQVPTTLLAMVDSSIGGKTGVDLPEAKNFVGAFHQPRLVWMDLSTLATLPEAEFSNGMAEVVKSAVIADPKLFQILEKNRVGKNSPALGEIVLRCARIKAGVVSRDEKETRGLREILNFGHTLGHAIETLTGYRQYKHGQAVAIGMCAAGWLAQDLGLWSNPDQIRMEKLLLKAKLPIRMKTKLSPRLIEKVLLRDKKVRAGELRFVLPVRIGKVIVRKVPLILALKALAFVQPR